MDFLLGPVQIVLTGSRAYLYKREVSDAFI